MMRAMKYLLPLCLLVVGCYVAAEPEPASGAPSSAQAPPTTIAEHINPAPPAAPEAADGGTPAGPGCHWFMSMPWDSRTGYPGFACAASNAGSVVTASLTRGAQTIAFTGDISTAAATGPGSYPARSIVGTTLSVSDKPCTHWQGYVEVFAGPPYWDILVQATQQPPKDPSTGTPTGAESTCDPGVEVNVELRYGLL